MRNPFIKLASAELMERDDSTVLNPSAELMTDEEKRERLTQLEDWLLNPGSGEEEDGIREEIAKLKKELEID